MFTKLGQINRGLKPIKPQFSLTTPNRVQVAKLKEAYNATHLFKLDALGELTMDIPYTISRGGEIVENKNIEKIKPLYYIKVALGNNVEWYVINQISEKSDKSEYKTIHAFHLPYVLSYNSIRELELTAVSCTEAVSTALEETDWSVGLIDPVFDDKFRTFEVSSKSILDFLYEIAETFEALITWDTTNQKVNFVKPDTYGQNRGLTVSYGKYLKSLSVDHQLDEMVTRLYLYGENGMSIQRVNPTGQPYIESFEYFMYPFKRDENRNVLSKSYYMSDELCHAILDYEELVKSKEGVFNDLLTRLEERQDELITRETELDDLNMDLAKIEDRYVILHQTEQIWTHDITHKGNQTTLKTEKLDPSGNKYLIAIYISDSTNLSVRLDDDEKQVESDTWTVLGRITGQEDTKIVLNGEAADVKVKAYVLEIDEEDFSDEVKNEDLLDKYIKDYKQQQVNAKQAEVDEIQDQIDDIYDEIKDFRREISIEQNFAPELIRERQRFIIRKDFQDDNYINDEELLQDGKKHFEKLKQPRTVIELDIVNFMNVVEAQRDWDKLNLGDYLTIKHELLGIKYSAQITDIYFDYHLGEIKIAITNIKNLAKNEAEQFRNILAGAIGSSTTVNMNLPKFGMIDEHANKLKSIMEEPWDATKRMILAGTNESVVIDRRGLVIGDPLDSKNWLVGNHKALAFTNDGGQSFKNAITHQGVVAEAVYGQLFVGENLRIENSSGTFKVDKDGVTIDGSALRFTSGQKSVEYNPDLIIKEKPVNRYKDNDKLSKPVMAPKLANDGSVIAHTKSKSDTANISFEWIYDPDDLQKDESDNIDGFLVYMYASPSTAPYHFGTDVMNEYVFEVPDVKRSLILYDVPNNLNYTFGIQAYRKVDSEIDINEIIFSPIVQSEVPIEHPYRLNQRTPFDGDIKGTISGSDYTEIASKAIRSIQTGVAYNGVQIDSNSGLVVTRADDLVRSVFNATDGIKIQRKENDIWKDVFWADTQGVINARGLVITTDDGTKALIDAMNKKIDFGSFDVIAGTIKGENIDTDTITAKHIKVESITQDRLDVLAKNMINNWTKTNDINTGWSIFSGTGSFTKYTSNLKNNTTVAYLTTDTDVTLASDPVEVDPNKNYKVSMSVYCNSDFGVRLFGAYAYDENMNRVPLTEWNIEKQEWGDETTGGAYFWSHSGQILTPGGSLAYRDMEAYIVASNVEDNGVPKGRNVDKHFRLPSNAKYVRVFVMNSGNGGNSSRAQIWSPNMMVADVSRLSFSMLETGTLKVGGELNGNGVFQVLDENDDVVAQLDVENRGFDHLRVVNLDCDNVVQKYVGDSVIYVNFNTGSDEDGDGSSAMPYKTLQKAIDSLEYYLEDNVRIQVQNGPSGEKYTTYENVVISGFTGSGDLTIDLGGSFLGTPDNKIGTLGNTIDGNVVITSCTTQVIFRNGQINYREGESGKPYPLYIAQSNYVYAYSNKINGRKNAEAGILIEQGSKSRLMANEIYDCTTYCIRGQYACQVYSFNNKGSSQYGTSAHGGTTIHVSNGISPEGNPTHFHTGGAGQIIFTTANPTKPDDVNIDPGSSGSAPPPAPKTTSWSKTNSASWRSNYGWKDENKVGANKRVYQGQYSGGGHYRGLWFFGSGPSNTLTSKNIETLKLKITRYTAGGNSGAVTAYIRYHTYASKPSGAPALTSSTTGNGIYTGNEVKVSFKLGETKTVTLPAWFRDAFKRGTAKGIAIYVSGNSPYMIFKESATLTATYY